MSFSFTAAGDRKQVAAQLKAIKDSGDDSLKTALAELLAEHVDKSELHGYENDGSTWRQVYLIEAYGHSGPQSALSLHVDIKTPYLPVVKETADELAAELTEKLAEEADVIDAEITDDED